MKPNGFWLKPNVFVKSNEKGTQKTKAVELSEHYKIA
jgi:hypothetical protein